MRIARWLMVFWWVASGCADLGEVDPMQDEDPASRPDDDEGAPPDTQQPSVLLCQAQLALSGTLTPDGAAPGPDDGCVPAGVWTVDLTMVDPGACGDLAIETHRAYQVAADDGTTVTYLGTDDGDASLKVTGEGGGCQGNFEHYAADGLSLLLVKPWTSGLTIGGIATYEEYRQSQR